MSKPVFKFTLLIAVIISFWSLVTPIFEFPDEQAHIESVEYIANHGRMSDGKQLDMTKEMKLTQDYLGVFRDQYGNNRYTYHSDYTLDYTNSYIGKYEPAIQSLNNSDNRDIYIWKEAAQYPPLYYLYESFWYKLVADKDIIYRLYTLRVGNVLLASITAYLIYLIGIHLFHKRVYAQTLTILVMLQPMYSFLSAGVNSDNLHNLLFTAILYIGLLIVKSGFTTPTALSALFFLVMDYYTKPQAFIAIPVLIFAYLLHIIKVKNWKMFRWLTAIGVIAFIFVLSPLNPYLSWVNSPNLKQTVFSDFLKFSLDKLLSQNIVWYWGVYKWLGVVLPPIYWQVANRLVLLSAFGILLYIWKVYKKKNVVVDIFSVMYMLLAITIYVTSIYYFDWQYHKTVGYSLGVQARYFFPAISMQMGILMTGILSLGWSSKITAWLRSGLVIFIFWMQLGGLWRLITSYYDTSSIGVFITQVSQYKPWFAKGDMWFLWISLYALSIICLVIKTINSNQKTSNS